jgi:hypothetical protein
VRLVLRGALLTIFAAALGACAGQGKPEVGVTDPCLTPEASLFDCPPATVTPFTLEDACQKLVDCNVIALDDPNGNDDFQGCLDRLHMPDFTANRLDFTLHCVEVTTCSDLSQGWNSPCFVFGGEP